MQTKTDQDTDKTAANIGRLLSPRSVAIVGASAKPGSLGRLILDNLIRFDFTGAIYPINPGRDEVLGYPCTARIAELPLGVDCVVLAAPRGSILAAVHACAERQVGGIIIFSAGFAELGGEGAALQEEIAQVARDSGMAIEGPNCLGHINYLDGAPLTFSTVEPATPPAQAIAILSQSGAMAAAARVALQSRGLPISLSISTGNEAGCGVEDFLDYALTRGGSQVIGLVVETVRHPRRFLALAERARRQGVTLVLLHPGRSSAAKLATRTHTGGMAGDYALMKVSVERRGVMMAETIEALIDLTECAFRCPRRPHGGVAVIGESGAYKALTLDYCDTIGLTLPQPDDDAARTLNALAPELVVSSNPLDLTAQGLVNPGLYAKAAEALMADGRCGSLLVTIILSSASMAARKMPSLIESLPAWAGRWTTVFAMLGEDAPIGEDIVDAVRQAGVPFFRSPERALRALQRFTDWAEQAARPLSPPQPPATRLPPGVILEHQAKDALEAAGLPMPARQTTENLTQAQAAAAKIGFPVALKIQSAATLHKSDIGGVALGVADAADLARQWIRLQAVITERLAGCPSASILVEAMAEPGVELLLGARNDPDWGLLISVGFGGIETEVIADVRHLSPDLTLDEIERSLLRLKRAALLGPFRGRPARDLRAVAQAVQIVSRFMQTHPEVRELDINPLLVLAEGQGVAALDALMVCD